MTFTCGPGVSLLFFLPPLLLILLSSTPSSTHHSIRGRPASPHRRTSPLLQLFAVIHGSTAARRDFGLVVSPSLLCHPSLVPPSLSPSRPTPTRRLLLVSRKVKPASALDGPRHHSIRSTSARLLRYFPHDGSSVSTSSSGLQKYLLRDKSLFSLLENTSPHSTSNPPDQTSSLRLYFVFLFTPLRPVPLPSAMPYFTLHSPVKAYLRAFLSTCRRRRRVTCSHWTT